MNATDPSGAASLADRRAAGRRLRKKVPRSGHGAWKPGPKRRDPIELLKKQDRVRIPELVPIRYGRMAASPFTFLRGAAIVMAADLAVTPITGLRVQACGDAHLINFGVFATPERDLVFDLNDFDETLPGAVRVGPQAAGGERRRRRARHRARREPDCLRGGAHVRAGLREKMTRVRRDGHAGRLVLAHRRRHRARAARRAARRLRGADRQGPHAHEPQALDKLTRMVDGRRVIVDDPPLVEHVPLASDQAAAGLRDVYSQYKASLPEDRRTCSTATEFVDAARKVVGVGSVGTRCYVALLDGAGDDDPLFLQVKEARPSVLEPHAGASVFATTASGSSCGQRLMQAASDLFLGWIRDAEAATTTCASCAT